MNQKLPEKTQASSVEKVHFTDGMIVTAEDLQDAMSYPVDVFRTLVRAFFGCGVVCGLEVKLLESETGECADSYPVCISPGVAIDCQGYPIELCRAVTLEFPKDDCGPYKACIAIRRLASEECPRPADVCSSGSKDAAYECTRLREHVQVKAFRTDSETGTNELPASTCESTAVLPDASEEEACPGTEEAAPSGAGKSDACTCLKACENGGCCDETWVLLACVEVTVGESNDEIVISNTRRKYVKPISCHCPAPAE